jgi:2-dehydro-3-deoxyphosphogalactonate aldolase
MTMEAFSKWLQPLPLVAILRGVKPDEVISIAEVLVEAGFRIIEVPLNSPRPLSSIEMLAAHFGDRLLTGAGTVIDAAAVTGVAVAGGRLIVMPHADTEVVAAAKLQGLYALPGFATPTEAFRMLAADADGLKLFPAEANPPPVLKAMRAVLPAKTSVLPVGGITPDNLEAYWNAGANGFGLGSALYKPGMHVEQVAERAAAFVARIRELPRTCAA